MRQSHLALLGGADAASLRRQLEELRDLPLRIDDSVIRLEAPDDAGGPLRAALIAADQDELMERAALLARWLEEEPPDPVRIESGLVLGRAQQNPRVGFLFPGQGAPVHAESGYLDDWLPEAAAVYGQADDLQASGEVPDKLVQLAVVTASIAGLRALRQLGVEAEFGLGHSVGELTALHWGGAVDVGTGLRIARQRGEAMTAHATAAGAMATIEANEETFARLLDGASVTVACHNSPLNHVISGEVEEVDAIVARALAEDGARALRLRVVGAFHSPLMRAAAPVFERSLAEERLGRLERTVYSTISGAELSPDTDLRTLLVRQITEPVLFLEAARGALEGTQLLIEVGPGKMLSGLVSEFAAVPTVSLCVGNSSPQGLLTAVGAAHAIGVPVRAERLRDDGESAQRAA